MSNDFDAKVRKLVAEAEGDPRTTWELISLALTEQDDEGAWEPVTVLHRRGSRDALAAALTLTRSACHVERTLGANILGQLGVPARTFPAECVAGLLAMPPGETDADVLDAVCIALGHQHNPAAVPALVGLSGHPNTDVRYAVAISLGMFHDATAVSALVALTADPSARVRDWATFGLGSLNDADTPAIRDALIRRTADGDEVVRGEALVGLARRGDDRVVDLLIGELTRDTESDGYDFVIEAAEEIASPRMLPALTRLKQSAPDGGGRFDKAIRRSRGE